MSRRLQRTIWASTWLTPCGEDAAHLSCGPFDLSGGDHLSITTSNDSIVKILPNPAHTGLDNRLTPQRPGQAIITLAFPSNASIGGFDASSGGLQPVSEDEYSIDTLIPTASSSTSTSAIQQQQQQQRRSVTVLVEDTYQAGWPRVTNITETSFLIQANMSAPGQEVHCLVWPSRRLEAAEASGEGPPSSQQVLQAGIPLQHANDSRSGNGFS